jgi:hypothetical protein
MVKWFAYQAGFVALAWFGYHEGIQWCENVFMFFTLGKCILAITVTIIIGILKKTLSDGSLGETQTTEFHDTIKDKIRMPTIIPLIVNTLFIAYLAGLGHFFLATAWVVVAMCNYICLSLMNDVRVLARDFVERRDAREELDEAITRRRAASRRADDVMERNDHQWTVDEITGQRIPDPDALFDSFDADDNELFRMGITTTEREE